MKTQHLFNAPAIAGIAASALPLVFWTAVCTELLFHNSFLMNNFFTPMEQTSSFLSIFFLVILPGIVLLLNFFFVFRFGFEKEGEELRLSATLRLKPLNLAVIAFTGANVLLILAYAVTENFMLIARS
jgi:hypothetical protein